MAHRPPTPKYALTLLALASVLLGGLIATAAAATGGTALAAIPATVLPDSRSAGGPSPHDDPAYRAAWPHTPRLVRDTGGEQHLACPAAGGPATGRHVVLPDLCSWVSRPPEEAARELIPAGLPPGRAPPRAPWAG